MPSPCPACGTDIPVADINVQMDTAICRACGHATAYSAIVHAPVLSVHTAPPDGCDVQNDGVRWRAVATTRSWRAIPLYFFATIWWGFLSIFIGLSFTAGKASTLIILFMSGHIAAGVFVVLTALCYTFGTTEVIIERDLLTVSLGFGGIRRRWSRPVGEIRGVRRAIATSGGWQFNFSRGHLADCLEIEGPKPLKFGSLLSDERRQFMHAAMAAELARRRRQGEIEASSDIPAAAGKTESSVPRRW